MALGVSIFLQAIERFIDVQEVQNPVLVLIIGCVGFALNVTSVFVLHEHDRAPLRSEGELSPELAKLHAAHRHTRALALTGMNNKPDKDLNIVGVLVHIAGDAANNIGVVISGAIIWQLTSPGRFYTDPAISLAISAMIFFSSIPLVRQSGMILLQSAPRDVDPADVKADIQQIPGVLGIHELHIWRLNQEKTLASAHVYVRDTSISEFVKVADTVRQCLHAYGAHSTTIQPELEEETFSEGAEAS